MKRLLLPLICLVYCSQSLAQSIPFELWNKHKESIFFGIFDDLSEVHGKNYQELKQGAWNSATVNTKRPIYLAVSFGNVPQKGKPIDVYQLKNNSWKFAYLRLTAIPQKIRRQNKTATREFLLSAQEGPYLASFAKQEPSDLARDNIATQDIIHSQVVY